MSKKLVVSVRDVKVGEYRSLVQVGSRAEGEHQFMGLLIDPKSPCHRFPRDYQLHHLGNFNTITGVLEPAVDATLDITPYVLVDELVESNKAVSDFKPSVG